MRRGRHGQGSDEGSADQAPAVVQIKSSGGDAAMKRGGCFRWRAAEVAAQGKRNGDKYVGSKWAGGPRARRNGDKYGLSGISPE